MALDTLLVDRTREALASQTENVVEKKMFGGICFMVNDKMCVGVREKELMCRMDPEDAEIELEKGNCRIMVHGKKPIRGYIFVEEIGYRNPRDFQRLIDLCIDFNRIARSTKRK